MGGGTPSLFSPESVDRLLKGIFNNAAVTENVEITLEANPGTFESSKFEEFREMGINRLSIGIQSFNDENLRLLGRVHTAREAIKAIEMTREAGFENFNLDIMYGLPNGTLQRTIHDIKTAISLGPTHISCYQLTLEPNTCFYKFPPKLPAADAIYSTQQSAQKILANDGYLQYEVSAYSKIENQCQQNLNYWNFGDYLGIGAGAHGKISLTLPDNIIRYSKFRGPSQYMGKEKTQQQSSIDLHDIPLEYVMNLLRLKNGFDYKSYRRRTGLEFTTLQPIISECVKQGLLVFENNRYFCSEKGWDFLDDVVEKFIRA
jgi:oxygen-independent coproporphyrinogen-3 oxidase